MKAAAAILVLLATASFAAARNLDADTVSHRRQLLAQKGMASTKALLGLDKNDKQLRVLAHGDSITEGWINTAWIKMPWTPKLQQQLQQKLGGDWRVEVQNGGLGGAGVLDALNPLLQSQLADARGKGKPYHFIVFEAGINDILMKNQKAPEIFERMKEMWRAANAEGSTVLVIPTLPTNAQGDAENQRRELTSKVRQYVAEQNASGNSGLVLVDMESAFDYYKLSEQRRKELFDDGIHLTQAGYDLMGDLVYQALVRAMAV